MERARNKTLAGDTVFSECESRFNPCSPLILEMIEKGYPSLERLRELDTGYERDVMGDVDVLKFYRDNMERCDELLDPLVDLMFRKPETFGSFNCNNFDVPPRLNEFCSKTLMGLDVDLVELGSGPESSKVAQKCFDPYHYVPVEEGSIGKEEMQDALNGLSTVVSRNAYQNTDFETNTNAVHIVPRSKVMCEAGLLTEREDGRYERSLIMRGGNAICERDRSEDSCSFRVLFPMYAVLFYISDVVVTLVESCARAPACIAMLSSFTTPGTSNDVLKCDEFHHKVDGESVWLIGAKGCAALYTRMGTQIGCFFYDSKDTFFFNFERIGQNLIPNCCFWNGLKIPQYVDTMLEFFGHVTLIIPHHTICHNRASFPCDGVVGVSRDQFCSFYYKKRRHKTIDVDQDTIGRLKSGLHHDYPIINKSAVCTNKVCRYLVEHEILSADGKSVGTGKIYLTHDVCREDKIFPDTITKCRNLFNQPVAEHLHRYTQVSIPFFESDNQTEVSPLGGIE